MASVEQTSDDGMPELVEEELKHDLNELCKYVHKLFGYCEGARRATDLVVLDIGRLRKTV